MLHRNPSFVRRRFSAVVRLPALAPRYTKRLMFSDARNRKRKVGQRRNTSPQQPSAFFFRDICSHVSILIIFVFAWISRHSRLPPPFSRYKENLSLSAGWWRQLYIPKKVQNSTKACVAWGRGGGEGWRKGRGEQDRRRTLIFQVFFSRNRNET